MRKILPAEKLEMKAQDAIAKYHPEIVKEVEDAVQSNKIVVVGMAHNPVVKKAQKNLKEAGLNYKYMEYGNYFSMWKPRLALKLWSGWPTFPQVFINSKLVGGNQELEELLISGTLK